MKRHALLLAFLFAFLVSSSGLCATPVADSTSFDPTAVAVKAQSLGGIPVGTIISWPVAQNPDDFSNSDGTFNWLECNGQSVNATVYPELSALVGPTVPDLRGLFLRGQGGNSAGLGINQGDAIRNITGSTGYVQGQEIAAGKYSGAFYVIDDLPESIGYGGAYARRHTKFGIDASRIVPTAPENRPVNVAVRYLMRARP